MGFQKGAGQGIGFCSGCLLMAIAIPVLAMGGVGSWLDGIGKRVNPPTGAVPTTPRPTMRVMPTPLATPRVTPAPPVWRDDFCEAMRVTVESGDGPRTLESAIRSGTIADLRSAGRSIKTDGTAVAAAWTDLESRAVYRDVRFFGLSIGLDLIDLGAMVLYAADHPDQADANGKRLVRQVKALNTDVGKSADAIAEFNVGHPLFCSP